MNLDMNLDPYEPRIILDHSTGPWLVTSTIVVIVVVVVVVVVHILMFIVFATLTPAQELSALCRHRLTDGN